VLFGATVHSLAVSKGRKKQPEQSQKKCTQEETRIAVRSAPRVEAPRTTAHMRMANEFPSANVRKRTLFINTVIHHWKSK
jgi:hypothetical protein